MTGACALSVSVALARVRDQSATRGGDTPVEGIDSVVAVRWTSRVEGRERVRSPRVVDSSGG